MRKKDVGAALVRLAEKLLDAAAKPGNGLESSPKPHQTNSLTCIQSTPLFVFLDPNPIKPPSNLKSNQTAHTTQTGLNPSQTCFQASDQTLYALVY
jgi:hypothetical protein